MPNLERLVELANNLDNSSSTEGCSGGVVVVDESCLAELLKCIGNIETSMKLAKSDLPAGTITINLNVFDDGGNVVKGATSDLTLEEVSDIISHAAQWAIINRSARRSSGDTDDVLAELENALEVAGVI